MVVVGVDACRQGWVAIVLRDDARPEGIVAPTLEVVGARVPDADGFAVDIPIGLPDAGRRAADTEARAVVGPRYRSVFSAPVRPAVTATSHAEASEISSRLTGQGVSQQAYALGPKILEAERWLGQLEVPVWEVHPEVSFTLLLGAPPSAPKTSWAGLLERFEALGAQGIALDDLGVAGRQAGSDDVLDAAVAAWSCARLVRGEGRCWPEPPERDPLTGREMAIWA